jgi:hypothetical protein
LNICTPEAEIVTIDPIKMSRAIVLLSVLCCVNHHISHVLAGSNAEFEVLSEPVESETWVKVDTYPAFIEADGFYDQVKALALDCYDELVFDGEVKIVIQEETSSDYAAAISCDSGTLYLQFKASAEVPIVTLAAGDLTGFSAEASAKLETNKKQVGSVASFLISPLALTFAASISCYITRQ